MNYAKAYGCIQGYLSMVVESLEIKIAHDYKGEVKIPEEVIEELKAQISKMLKRSEEVGNEPSEIYKLPEAFNKEEVKADIIEASMDDFYLKEYDASDPTCNLPVPEEDAEDEEHVKPGCFNG